MSPTFYLREKQHVRQLACVETGPHCSEHTDLLQCVCVSVCVLGGGGGCLCVGACSGQIFASSLRQRGYWKAARQRLEHPSDKRQEEKDRTRGNWKSDRLDEREGGRDRRGPGCSRLCVFCVCVSWVSTGTHHETDKGRFVWQIQLRD